MALLRILIIIGLIYFLIRFITKNFLKNIANKLNEKPEDFFNINNDEPQREEGDIIIENLPEKKNNIDKSAGEYTNFEEIED